MGDTLTPVASNRRLPCHGRRRRHWTSVNSALPSRGMYTMQALCSRSAISRKTGDKWVARVAEEGRAGLQDRSRAPLSCPHQTSERVAALIIAARRAHPDWGPQLLLQWLRPRHPRVHDWLATSTAGAR